MNAPSIEQLVAAQRRFFASGQTLDLAFRKQSLLTLKRAIRAHEEAVNAALMQDLGKSAAETYMCETGMTLSELSYMISHLGRFAKKRRVLTPLAQFPSDSFTVREPYGVALIMAPWNYPFMLLMEPLIGALAAGNCCMLKPSAYAPATSKVIAQIVAECFPPEYVALVEGGRAENQALLHQRFDYIFFTGGVTVGREVMRAASEHLTPVTLELGGKSPCIVDSTAKLKLAAKRIVFGKYLNCGQTCVAPDYILCHRSVKDALVEEICRQVRAQYGQAPLENPDYGKIVNQKHFDRLCALLDPDKVVLGGAARAETLQIEPTVMDSVSWDDAVMQEEIFGPLLPIMTYDKLEDAVSYIRDHNKPLALYLFTENDKVEQDVLSQLSFGGGCINDTIIHLATPYLGFGGVGNSGMGSYHGKKSFDTFTHEKSIIKKSDKIDIPVRYMPYNKAKEQLMKFFLKL